MLQRLRTRLRSWLGLEHFETLLLDEVRSERTNRERQVGSLLRRESDTSRAQSRSATSLVSLRREVEELGLLARTTSDALGGVWRTASGHTVPIRLLSDTHLQAILDGDFGGHETRELVKAEQDRRTEDDRWAARQGPGSPRQRLAKVEEQLYALRGYFPPLPPPGTVRHRSTSTGSPTYSKPFHLTDDSDAGRARRATALMDELREELLVENKGRRRIAVNTLARMLGLREDY